MFYPVRDDFVNVLTSTLYDYCKSNPPICF